MATLKYSRQRASIKEYLDHTTEHPTADTVYSSCKRRITPLYQSWDCLSESESACLTWAKQLRLPLLTVGTDLMAILTHTITLYALVATGYLICISTKLTSIP